MENKVELLGFYGGDKRHCLSAWQSTTEELGVELPVNIHDRVDIIFNHVASTKKKTPKELLDFLAEHEHETPFEKSVLDFQVTGDIASHIHQIKHRISSVNAESARYKEFIKDRWYIPKDFYLYEVSEQSRHWLRKYGYGCPDSEFVTWAEILNSFCEMAFGVYHRACDDITECSSRKRAKESARYFLPYATQLNYDVMFNFRSFMHFQHLRNSEHAQKEICWIAQEMLRLVKEIPGEPFKYSLEAFGY